MSNERRAKPTKSFTDALYDFFCMAKGRSQNHIIRFFLEQIIEHSNVCEQGSVLIHSASDQAGDLGKLVIAGTRTNANSVAALIKESVSFEADEGLGGLAFRTRTPEGADDAKEHPQFVPVMGQDIGPIYCVPILLDDRKEPFGVVAFHDTAGKPAIQRDRQKQMEISVKALESILALSPLKLVDRERVFIVHGRDERLRQELDEILRNEKIEPVVIQALARTGQDLLAFLEDQIRDCVAGFVLLTPDDEGRLYQFGEPLRQRARQNVIFEGGYLTALFRDTQRVCFLQHGELEIPSDLHGLLMERFTDRLDPERIRLTLRHWGMNGREATQKPVTSPAGS